MPTNWLPTNYGWIVWDKDNGKNDFSDCELAYTNFLNAIRKFTWRWNGMLQQNMKNKEQRIYPTQKPIPVMRWIISKFTNSNDLICDPFCGSGSTAVACIIEHRDYICRDINQKAINIAQKRIETEQSKLTLFQESKMKTVEIRIEKNDNDPFNENEGFTLQIARLDENGKADSYILYNESFENIRFSGKVWKRKQLKPFTCADVCANKFYDIYLDERNLLPKPIPIV